MAANPAAYWANASALANAARSALRGMKLVWLTPDVPPSGAYEAMSIDLLLVVVNSMPWFTKVPEPVPAVPCIPMLIKSPDAIVSVASSFSNKPEVEAVMLMTRFPVAPLILENTVVVVLLVLALRYA